MPKLTIFVKLQDVITISSFHFAHGGHFENMQIRIIQVFGYIRFIFNEENHLHMNFWTCTTRSMQTTTTDEAIHCLMHDYPVYELNPGNFVFYK